MFYFFTVITIPYRLWSNPKDAQEKLQRFLENSDVLNIPCSKQTFILQKYLL